jgi:hypothetical protein
MYKNRVTHGRIGRVGRSANSPRLFTPGETKAFKGPVIIYGRGGREKIRGGHMYK